MKNIKILLINDNPTETEIIQKVLEQMELKCTLHVAKTGEEGLDLLMGSSQLFTKKYMWMRKVRPDVILVNEYLSDTPGLKFLEIVRKYYSLKNIKIFLLTDSESNNNQVVCEQLEISGCLQRPFYFDENSPGGFKLLKSELNADQSYMTLLPMTELNTQIPKKDLSILNGSTIKGKIIYLSTVHSIGAKTAICAVSTLIISWAANDFNGQAHQANFSEKEVVKLSTKKNLIEKIDSSSFESINIQENISTKKQVTSVQVEGTQEKLSIPDSVDLNSEIEKENLSSNRSEMFKIRVIEEPDTIRN